MLHFVVDIIFKEDFQKIEPVVPAHREFLQSGYDKGLLLCSGPKIPRTGGIVIARAESREQIEELFTHDPYSLNGFADYRFTEFNPVKFQPLLKDWIEE